MRFVEDFFLMLMLSLKCGLDRYYFLENGSNNRIYDYIMVVEMINNLILMKIRLEGSGFINFYYFYNVEDLMFILFYYLILIKKL